MEEKILALLQKELPNINFTASDKLLTDGTIDSVSLVEIISLFTMEFGVNIPYKEIVEDNFNSVAAMAALVEKLQA